jgi:thymidine phosphorylase
VQRGQPLFHLHAQTLGELEYAQDYVAAQQDLVSIGEAA